MPSVLKKWEGGGESGYYFFCPGCKEEHIIRTSPSGWGWNGNLEKPTFTPSVKVSGLKVIRDENGKWTGDWEKDANGNTIPEICHSFVTDGQIQFLGDCTHALANQTVDLPPWPIETGEDT